jgi:hypothetical protein
VETFHAIFPRYGKVFLRFSMLWKSFFHSMEKMGRFFHGMEKFYAIFPRYGKLFSTVWKICVAGLFHSGAKRKGLIFKGGGWRAAGVVFFLGGGGGGVF